MSTVKVGDSLTVPHVPTGAHNPFTVDDVGYQEEGPFYSGRWASGQWAIIFPEDLED